MTKLSITTAWNEASAFVAREARLLLPVAFLLIALPGAVLKLAMPTPLPGQPPAPGAWLALLPVVVVVGMIGSIALSYLALRPGASVAEALQTGARRFIMLFAASLLVGLALIAAMIPLFVLVGGGAILTGARPEAMVGPILLLTLIAVVASIALWVRLMLMTPIAAAETIGPIGIIKRSWALTRGHFWRLLGFVLLVLLAFVVVSMAVGAIGGLLIVLLAGQPEPGSVAAYLIVLVEAALNMVLTLYLSALVAKLYLQLSDRGPQGVFA